MTINLHLPSHIDTLRPKITVIGVGGAGGNASGPWRFGAALRMVVNSSSFNQYAQRR
jgi:hypothetical protein